MSLGNLYICTTLQFGIPIENSYALGNKEKTFLIMVALSAVAEREL